MGNYNEALARGGVILAGEWLRPVAKGACSKRSEWGRALSQSICTGGRTTCRTLSWMKGANLYWVRSVQQTAPNLSGWDGSLRQNVRLREIMFTGIDE